MRRRGGHRLLKTVLLYPQNKSSLLHGKPNTRKRMLEMKNIFFKKNKGPVATVIDILKKPF